MDCVRQIGKITSKQRSTLPPIARDLLPSNRRRLSTAGSTPVCQTSRRTQGTVVDDVGFISKLIDDLVDRKIADPARIYVIGDSRGGLMNVRTHVSSGRQDCLPRANLLLLCSSGWRSQNGRVPSRAAAILLLRPRRSTGTRPHLVPTSADQP